MLQKCSLFKVAGVFFREPVKKHYLRELADKSGLAHTSVKRHLQVLKKQSIIKQKAEKRGKRNFPIYFANLESNVFRMNKLAYNLNILFTSGLIDYVEEKTTPDCIILFGSFIRGEDTEESDIDLFVQSQKKTLEMNKFERNLGRNIQLHFKENIDNYPDELKNNIINGLVLRGVLTVFK